MQHGKKSTCDICEKKFDSDIEKKIQKYTHSFMNVVYVLKDL